jgi:hypothetical protein
LKKTLEGFSLFASGKARIFTVPFERAEVA